MSSSRPSSIKTAKSPRTQDAAGPPRSPPTPHFDDPPAPQHQEPPDRDSAFDAEPEDEADRDHDNDDIPYPEPSSEQTLLPPPNFNPFFTLIEDSTSNEHHHPYVHYVFADDDPVIVTAAAIRSLGLDETQFLPQNIADHEDNRMHHDDDGRHNPEQDSDHEVESPLPPPIPGVKERYILVHVAADGHTIEDAQSLSPEWQITNANVRSAPSFDDEQSPDHAYMLRIEGVETPAKAKGKTKGDPGENKLKQATEKAKGDIFAAMDGLVQGVEDKLQVAAMIVGRENIPGIGSVLVPGAVEEGKGKDED